MMSRAARIGCKAVVDSFGAGVVPGSLPNTKAGTRCVHQLSDVPSGAAPSGRCARWFPWQERERGLEEDSFGRRSPLQAAFLLTTTTRACASFSMGDEVERTQSQ